MRYAMVLLENGTRRPAIIEDQMVKLLDPALADLRAFLHLSPEERRLAVRDEQVGRDEVRLLAPLQPPKNVFCVGRNYLAHAEESTRAQGVKLDLPDRPTFFTKAPTSIAGPEQSLRLSAAVSSKYDWEAELGVVIGIRCRDVAEEHALEAVFGYTCVNDVSARDLQQAYGQWFKGKSIDDTCPLGPWVVDAETVGDPQQLAIGLRVNGESKQNGSTSDMIFPVARIIAELSRGMTLEPGDVIATGTPDGVGFARTPPEFLRDGDVVEVEIQNIGVLRNTVALAA